LLHLRYNPEHIAERGRHGRIDRVARGKT
jgi:hypothetical protein